MGVIWEWSYLTQSNSNQRFSNLHWSGRNGISRKWIVDSAEFYDFMLSFMDAIGYLDIAGGIVVKVYSYSADGLRF